MKCLKPGLTLVTVILMGIAVSASAQVYKSVDENGNIIYTDQAPSAGAEPMEMPGLSVVEAPEYHRKAVPAKESDVDENGLVTDLRTLKRGYRDFNIVSPMPEQTFWGTANSVTVAWDTAHELQEGMTVVVYLDGQAYPPTEQRVIATGRLDRGEHTARAELLDGQNRKIATAAPVTFYVKQQSRINTGALISPYQGS